VALPGYPIETARLALRPFTPDDFDDLYAYQSRPDVARYLHWEARDQAQVRQALEARAEGSRVLKDYTSLVSTYKRVYLITPRAPEVPAALNQVAELYRTMGDLFAEKYYQLAVNSFQFLLRYPRRLLKIICLPSRVLVQL